MLSDVTNPTLIRSAGGEVALDQIIVNRRSWLLSVTALLDCRGEDLMLLAQSVNPVFRRGMTESVQLIGNEPVAELWIILMNVEHHVH